MATREENGQDPWNKRKKCLVVPLDVRIRVQKKEKQTKDGLHFMLFEAPFAAKHRLLWLQAIKWTGWTDETCNDNPTFKT